MANYLRYEIWSRITKKNNGQTDDVLRKCVKSGTITSGASMSSAVTVPSNGGQSEYVLVLKAKGGAVYVHLPETGDPSGSGAHNANDAQPRVLIDPADPAFVCSVGGGKKFGVVDAAAFS